MATEIINNGASIKIVSDGSPRFINKLQVREIGIVRDSIIKIDIGQGALYNVFIDQTEVTNPATASPEELRDAIDGMLQTSLSGQSTFEGQRLEIETMQEIIQRVDKLADFMDTLNEKVFYEPLVVDESNANVVYKGYANVGVKHSDASWAILKITNRKGVLSYQWANGTKSFTNIWDNRATLNYI